jgi:hypothetical protein
VFRHVPPSGRWIEELVDLTAYAGHAVEVVLRCESGASTAGTAGFWASPILMSRGRPHPNVLVICMDSLRADHVHCYGYDRRTTPTLDSLASHGHMFRQAISQSSWTLPAHASLFSSLYMRTHGVTSPREALSSSASTIAESLRRAGYVTAAVLSGGPVTPEYGLAQGFDVYDTGCRSGGLEGVIKPTNACTNQRVFKVLDQCGRCPLFLFVQYWDVHFDYAPPAPYDTLFDADYSGHLSVGRVRNNRFVPQKLSPRDLSHAVALYDGEIAHTDGYVGRLLARLRALHLSDNTLVVVTSDHGDEFLEHGAAGHCHSLFQELIHVPLLWVPPGGTVPSAIDDRVELIDVAPSWTGSGFRSRSAWRGARCCPSSGANMMIRDQLSPRHGRGRDGRRCWWVARSSYSLSVAAPWHTI